MLGRLVGFFGSTKWGKAMFEKWLAAQLEKAIRESPYMKNVKVEDEAAFKAGIQQIAAGALAAVTATDIDVMTLLKGAGAIK